MSSKYAKLSASEMDAKVDELWKWIESEPDLPQNIDKLLLLRYLKTFGFRLEKAQELIKFSFGLRAKNQNIFTNRDFLSPEIAKVLEICDMVPMTKATPENYKCCIFRLGDPKTDGFSFDAMIKLFFMVADVRFVSPDPDPNNLADGEVPIFDMKHVSVWHLLKVTLSTLKLYFKYTQEAQPVRVKQVHVYNCTSFFNRIMLLIKPFLNANVAARFQLHAPGSDTIFKFIPREMLPEEYGGTAGPISDMKELWMERFLAKREYIMNDSNWIVSSKKEDQNNNEGF